MLHTKPRLSLIVTIVLCLSFFGFARNEPRAQQPASTSLSDETLLRAATEEFFAAYAKKDLEGMMRLWSAKSPDFASHKKKMQELFTATDKIEINHLALRKVTVEGEQMKVRITVEVSAIEKKTGKPAVGFGKMNRLLYLVKEGNVWKLWREVSAEEELAAVLVAAKTEEDRQALLAAEAELVTVELVRALQASGKNLMGRGDFAQAMSVALFTRAIAEQIGDKLGLARAVIFIGIVHYYRGEYASALEHYRKSMALAEASGSKTDVADALANIGLVNRRQGDYEGALEFYRKALAVYEAAGARDKTANTLSLIGSIHLSQGNYRLALEYYQKALPIFESIGDQTGQAGVLNNIGNVHQQQGNYSLAQDYYRKTLGLADTLKNRVLISYALNNIGTSNRMQGNYGPALKLYLDSLLIKEELGARASIANTLNHIAQTHLAQGNYTQALDYLRKSMALQEALGDKAGMAEALIQIGRVHESQGDYNQALEWAERAIVLAEQIGLRGTLWYAQTTAGRAYIALNRPAEARQALEKGIDIIEDLRAQVAGGELDQQRFFEDKVSPYHAMVALLVTENKMGEAFAYAERAKARVLSDVLRSGRVNINKAMLPQEREQERRLKVELVSFNSQISLESGRPQPDQNQLTDLKARRQKSRFDYEAFQTGLYASHSELKVLRGEVQSLSAEEAGALLPDEKSALLEYVVTEGKTFLFVLTKGGAGDQRPVDLRVYTLNIKQKDLTEHCERFRRALAQHDLGFVNPARELYDLLLGSAQKQLQGKSTLVIVPDAVLWELPFQALRTAQNRYLIEDRAISYAPSLTVLREMMKVRSRGLSRAADSATLLAFGNPALEKQTVERLKSVMMDEKLDPLPEAERLVKTLGQLYGATQSKVYVGAEAREERVKSEAGKYRILQLATHGILNNASPMYSHVMLAQGAGNVQEDGLLEAWEIMNLDLKADLVVLSACETARGRVGAGEGVIGLTWALFVAGSPTTVVSQWKVESASTTELMLEFHRNLQPKNKNLKSHVSTAKALQQAAKVMLRSNEYRNPFYWAGFVVVGDGR